MKKITKGFCALALLSLASAQIFAENITFNWGNGQSATVDIPSDLVSIVNENKGTIESALTKNNVTQEDFETNVKKFSYKYSTEYLKDFKTLTPYTDAKNGLDDFCDSLNDTIPNTQTIQNVWANSWIGKLTDLNFGFGVNAGVATLDITDVKKIANALAIDIDELDKTDNLVFPTLTADVRLGGFLLPLDFDVGFVFSTLDTRWIGALDSAISPSQFEYFSIGSDIRFKLFTKGAGLFRISASASGGFYYTNGSVNVSNSDASAALDFSSTTIFAGAQVSAKALCFVPFAGGRLMFTKSSVDWNAKADWTKIIKNGGNDFNEVLKYGILPEKFSGGSDSGLGVRPQIYGGIGIDLAIIDITVSASYDIAKSILGGAVSLRLALED